MRRLVPVQIIAVLLLAAPAAQAQEAPPAAPVKATMKLDLQRVGHVKRAVAFAGKTWRVRGSVHPYVAGQQVHVRVFLRNKMIMAKTKPIVPLTGGTAGTFVANFKSNIRGKLRIGVTHDATPEMRYAYAGTQRLNIIGGSAAQGQTGHTVQVMQRVLRDAGYVPGKRGVFDARTARAVHAFRKMSGLARTYTASRTVLRRLINGGGQFKVRHPEKGHHVEGDLTHQVLALIDNGKVQRLYPMSSGAPSTPTVLGSWRVYLRGFGTNAKGMVHSSFFIRGYAIHGYQSVPPYPASHGCLRVPVPDALSIYNWIRPGDWVSTYYRGGKRRYIEPSANAGP